jgi:hypothetical protein
MKCLPMATSSFLRRKAAQVSVAPVYTFAKKQLGLVKMHFTGGDWPSAQKILDKFITHIH